MAREMTPQAGKMTFEDVPIGSWVRFYQGGELVIGIVQYHVPSGPLGDPYVYTDIGSIGLEYIIEVRQ